MKRIFGLLGVVLLSAACLLPSVARADSVSANGTIAATGPSKVLTLNGQSTCSIAFAGNPVGLVAVPQASSDYGATWATANTINSGVINATGTFIGPIALTGTTNFRFNVTALTSGSITYVETCTNAPSGAVSGTFTVANPTAFPSPQPLQTAPDGSLTVTPKGTPTPVPQSSPGNVPLVVLANASAVPYNATSPQPVTTPAPAYKNSSGSTQAVLCDKTFLTPTAITSATTTLLLDAVAGKQYFICIIQDFSTGTNTSPLLNLEYGTKTTTDCDTGTTAINSPETGVAGNGSNANVLPALSMGQPYQPASTQLCIVTSGTVNFKVFILYALI